MRGRWFFVLAIAAVGTECSRPLEPGDAGTIVVGAGGKGGAGASGAAGGLASGGGAGSAPIDGGPVRLPRGEPCTSVADCASGFCTDGVCCNIACNTPCVSCATPGLVGICGPIPSGRAAHPHTCTPVVGFPCGNDGTCDGFGLCRLIPAGTLCAPGSCSGSTVTGAHACDGRGSCLPIEGDVLCGVYACDPATGWCRDRCATDTDCTGTPCVDGRCFLPPGD